MMNHDDEHINRDRTTTVLINKFINFRLIEISIHLIISTF